MKIINIVGARPNFMKIAPIVEAMKPYPNLEGILLHTGQHYDDAMSRIFFDELDLPKPDIYLGVGSGSHAHQTAAVMIAFEQVLNDHQPDLVLVVGDVNSTLACSLTAAKLGIPVAHVEAGLRSYDRQMPEEINRIVTDALSDFLFTTSKLAEENLTREGIPKEKIFFVGNVMIDTLQKHLVHARQQGTPAKLDVYAGDYVLLTLHRPSNVDNRGILSALLDALGEIQKDIPIIFPVHPRTMERIREFDLQGTLENAPDLRVMEPLGYLPFLDLMANAKFVLTDSGGIQEETTILGIPCLTIRENTERPITLTEGTNTLVGTDPQKILHQTQLILNGKGKTGDIPELWDGHAAERVVQVLNSILGDRKPI
jgi:UDP-N-acetylglucosamine 2-epimerase (non-hydrolysing)